MCVCVCVCIYIYIYIYKHTHIYIYICVKQKISYFYYVINRCIERTQRVRYYTRKADKPHRLSLQSVPKRGTYNMFLVTFHIKICYNSTSHGIAILIIQYNINTFLFCLNIILNEIKIAILWRLYPLIEFNIIPLHSNECSNFYSHKYIMTKSYKNYNFGTSVL